jgi:hypothetical protein
VWQPWGTQRDARLVFVHLPRTGGTSLTRDFFPKVFCPDQRFSVDNPLPGYQVGSVPQLLALPVRGQKRLGLIVGHMPFGVADTLTGAGPWHYVTLLRDPVERVASEYHQVRAEPSHPAHALVQNLSFIEYVRGNYGHAHNGMTRYLANEVYGAMYPSSSAMLRQALANARRCLMIGFTDRLSQFVRALCAYFGWVVPPVGVHNSARPSVDHLEPATEKAIRACNALDIELYETLRAAQASASAA